jgi:hypothetical protein
VIAIACGKLKSGTINALGTGFAIGTSKDGQTLFCTCEHIVKDVFAINFLQKEEGIKKGFVDNDIRIAILRNDKFEWTKVKNFWAGEVGEKGTNYTEKHDACILKLPGIKPPTLSLFNGNPTLASEVCIIGFPTFGNLQRESVQPFIQKSIISSALIYPFERSGSNVRSARFALGSIIGGGFSGSPVISIREGSVIGMTDYLPTELDIIDLKIRKPCIEGNLFLEYPAGISLAIPVAYIKGSLDAELKFG